MGISELIRTPATNLSEAREFAEVLCRKDILHHQRLMSDYFYEGKVISFLKLNDNSVDIVFHEQKNTCAYYFKTQHFENSNKNKPSERILLLLFNFFKAKLEYIPSRKKAI